MSFEVVSSVEPEYVRVTANGKYSFEKLFEFIALVRSISDSSVRSRALIDCRQIEGKMTEAERFQGGKKIAEIFGGRLRAAIVMPGGQVTKLGELAAVNRGALLLITECETEAMTWLLNVA